MRRVHGKKSSVEVQLNWVFVLIAGGLILGFFMTIVQNQKSASEQKTAHRVLSALDLIITKSGSSENSLESVPIPDVKFEFIYPRYMFNGQTRDLRGRFIFAPSFLQGQELAIWTKPWNLGFDVARFSYLSTPTIRYYLVTSDTMSDFAKSINESIEKTTKVNGEEQILVSMDFAKTAKDISGDGYGDEGKVRIIFFGVDPESAVLDESLVKLHNNQVSALYVYESDTGSDGKGIGQSNQMTGAIRFYLKDDDKFRPVSEKDYYLGTELLYGAIYTDDYKIYEGLFGKAIMKLKIISDLYVGRLKKLSIDSGNFQSKSCVYSANEETFNQISLSASNFTKEKNPESLTKIASFADELKTENLNYERAGCPFMY